MSMPMPGGQKPQSQSDLLEGKGVIKSLDTAGANVTLVHGPLPAIGWPAMTMTFPVSNASVLRGRKAGEHVTFAFSKPDAGKTPVITSLTPERAR
jgi:Cu(I)/Ag(I) efflux system membrane fusion protein